jgi:hypothetical protein
MKCDLVDCRQLLRLATPLLRLALMVEFVNFWDGYSHSGRVLPTWNQGDTTLREQ